MLYLGDPQIGFSGNETEDAIRFGLIAAAARGADAVIIAGDMCAGPHSQRLPAAVPAPSCTPPWTAGAG